SDLSLFRGAAFSLSPLNGGGIQDALLRSTYQRELSFLAGSAVAYGKLRELKKRRWRFKFDRAGQRFVLTPREKRVLAFIMLAFVLGLATKYYRDTHRAPPPPQAKKVTGRALRQSGSDSPSAPNPTPRQSQTQEPTPPY